MAESNASNWHVSVSQKDHDGQTVRGILIDRAKGIKALYSPESKTIIEYVFKRGRGWAEEQAVNFTKEHFSQFKSFNHISVDQLPDFLKVVGEKHNGECSEFFPNSPSFVLERIEEDTEEKGGAGSGNFGHSGRQGEIGGSGSGGVAISESALNTVLSSKDGFTVNIINGDIPKDGWAFAESKSSEKVLPATVGREELVKNIEEFIASHVAELTEGGKFLGGWQSKGELYLDVSTVIPMDKKDEALQRANDAKQQKIFNLKTFEEVETDYGKSGQKRKADIASSASDAEHEQGGHQGVGGEGGGQITAREKSVNLEKVLSDLQEMLKGGAGSGNFGHSGRSGEVGGSLSEQAVEEAQLSSQVRKQPTSLDRIRASNADPKKMTPSQKAKLADEVNRGDGSNYFIRNYPGSPNFIDVNNPKNDAEKERIAKFTQRILDVGHENELDRIQTAVRAETPFYKPTIKTTYETSSDGTQTPIQSQVDPTKPMEIHDPAKFPLSEKIKAVQIDGEITQSGRELTAEQFKSKAEEAISHYPTHLQDMMAKSLIGISAENLGGTSGGHYIVADNYNKPRTIAVNSNINDKVKNLYDTRATLTHELAHALDFSFASNDAGKLDESKNPLSISRAWKDVMKGGKPITSYARANSREYFAESVTAYVYAPNMLKEANAKAHGFIDDLFKGNMGAHRFTKAFIQDGHAENHDYQSTDGYGIIEDDFVESMVQYISMALDAQVSKGGSGSGNFGHSGRAGEVGGSGGESVSNNTGSAVMDSLAGASVGRLTGLGITTGSKEVQTALKMLKKVNAYTHNESTIAGIQASEQRGVPLNFPDKVKYEINDSTKAILENKMTGKETVSVLENGTEYSSLTSPVMASISNFPPDLQKQIALSVTSIKENGRLPNGVGGRYKQTFNLSTGKLQRGIEIGKEKGVLEGEATLTHEFAHALDYSFNQKIGTSLSDTKEFVAVMFAPKSTAITRYSLSDEKEYFAEHATAYINLPKQLEATHPHAHSFFKELFAGKRDYTSLVSKGQKIELDDEGNETMEINDDFDGSVVQIIADLEQALLNKGGAGSGNFGHGGRAGERGGSATADGANDAVKPLPEKDLTAKELSDYQHLTPSAKEDYLLHRGAGMEHVTAFALAEPSVDSGEHNDTAVIQEIVRSRLREFAVKTLKSAGHEYKAYKIGTFFHANEHLKSLGIIADDVKQGVFTTAGVPVAVWVGYEKQLFILKGGSGSGNFGHSGRQGEVGGSSSDGAVATPSEGKPIPQTEPKRVWIDHLEGMPKNTLEAHTRPDGTLTPERQKLHDEIRAMFLDSVEPTPEGEKPMAIVTMGGPASGKSSIVDGVQDGTWVNINADAVKEEIPEYQLSVLASAKDAAAISHEESSKLAYEIKNQAIVDRKNLIFDGTGKDTKKYEALFDQLHKAGYEVNLVMATVPVETARPRNESRAEKTGRFVPPEILDNAYAVIPHNFEANAKKADYAVLFSTEAMEYEMITEFDKTNGKTVHNGGYYDRFLKG